MKKKSIFIASIAIGAFVYTACTKENVKKTVEGENPVATMQLTTPQLNAAGGGGGGNSGAVIIGVAYGHDKIHCTCSGGKHLPCQGAGSNCVSYSSVVIYDSMQVVANAQGLKKNKAASSSIYAVAVSSESELTDLPEFAMPARSLVILDVDGNPTGEYLNIPEQMLKRNDEGKFQYFGLSYSNTPFYQNK